MKERPRSPTHAPAFKVEASLLINEGGLQCVPVVFVHPLEGGASIELVNDPCLDGVRVAAIDPLSAAQRGPGLVAFVLEDPMDAGRFHRGDVVRLSQG